MEVAAFKLENFPVNIKSVTVSFADGSRSICKYEGIHKKGKYDVFRYKCEDALVDLYVAAEGKSSVLGFSIVSLKTLDTDFPLEVCLGTEKPNKVLALTTHKDVGNFYSNAFGYYPPIAIDREPRSPKPSDTPEYPPPIKSIEHEYFMRGYPCWSYPIISKDFESIPHYSIFLLAECEDKYLALFSFTDGSATTYVNPELKLKVFVGKNVKTIGLSWIASITVDEDPYKAVENCVKAASSYAVFKPREMKKTPIIMEKFGWCSWNALLTDDLSHENVIKIVKGILNRGVHLGWVMIDDGWQDEIKKDRWPHRTLRSLSTNEKFPEGIEGVAKDLKKLGVNLVGLWHTINLHWSGFKENILKKLGVKGFFSRFNENYVPPPEMKTAFELYEGFFSWIKGNNIDFVKIDNQWVIHALYYGDFVVGEASRNVELAMQVAAYSNGLDILNCMSMAPENYSNFLFSNAMRISMDYIPFWKADAKLHTIFSIYNSLLFSHIAYPDYDMFISYDPYAKVHAVARVFSGGPIYITDRHPEKTDINLLKLFVLPDGRLVKVDEPALPTRDVLFRDPYNEPVLLKIAAKAGDNIAIAVFNVNKEGRKIEDSITLDLLPFTVEWEEYAYYKVFKGERGLLKSNEKLSISLEELDVEVIILAPVKNDKAIIGLKEYILPSSPIEIIGYINNKILVKSIASGTLLYYANKTFSEMKVKEGSITEI